MMINVRAWLTALLVAASFGTAAQAMPINYGDFVGAPGQGSFLSVTEDSMTDGTPLYGSPILLPDSLFFSPLTFTSFASDGASDFTSGLLTMIVEAAPGLTISELVIDVTADTTLLGTGTNATFSAIETQVFVEDLTPGVNPLISDSLTYVPDVPYEVPTDGFVEINGSLVLDLSSTAISRLMLTIDHQMLTASEDMTSSFIQTKSLDIDVSTIPIPEPASGLILLAGAFVLRRRR